jgi:hypothetical protein
MRPALFLRNSTTLGGFDERESESAGAPLKIFENPTPVALLIVLSARIGICQAESKCAIKEDRELPCCGRHGLRLSHTCGKPPVEGAE